MAFTRHLRAATVLTALLAIITGLLYPGIVSGLARTLFPHQAGGSLVEVNGRVVGSELIGQPFTADHYFHGRPSVSGYDGAASGGTNKGPTDSALAAAVAARVDTAVREGMKRGSVPADRVTASASGLDPHISPANASGQVARVARARGVDPGLVAALVAGHIEGRQFGLLGEPRVNVLLLNIALDSRFPRNSP